MRKKIIIKGADGRYYTNDYRNDFWSKDPDEAYEFNDEVEIEKHFESKPDKEYPSVELNEAVAEADFPLEQLTIWVKNN